MYPGQLTIHDELAAAGEAQPLRLADPPTLRAALERTGDDEALGTLQRLGETEAFGQLLRGLLEKNGWELTELEPGFAGRVALVAQREAFEAHGDGETLAEASVAVFTQVAVFYGLKRKDAAAA